MLIGERVRLNATRESGRLARVVNLGLGLSHNLLCEFFNIVAKYASILHEDSFVLFGVREITGLGW